MSRVTVAIIAGLCILYETGSHGLAEGTGAAKDGGALPASIASEQARPARVAVVKTRRELLICTAPDLPSLSWRNLRSGEMEVLDADMARALAARMSIRAVFVEDLPSTAIRMIERGACDMGMGGLGISPTRALRVALTKPFLSGPIAAVTQSGNARVQGWDMIDREGVAVAVVAGFVAEEVMRPQIHHAEFLSIGPPQMPEQEIGAGRANVFITDYANCRRLRDNDGWRVAEAPRAVGDTLYAYALPRGDSAWLTEVKGFLDTVKADGTLRHTAQRWGPRDMLVN